MLEFSDGEAQNRGNQSLEKREVGGGGGGDGRLINSICKREKEKRKEFVGDRSLAHKDKFREIFFITCKCFMFLPKKRYSLCASFDQRIRNACQKLNKLTRCSPSIYNHVFLS
jgi:hypothetical protein